MNTKLSSYIYQELHDIWRTFVLKISEYLYCISERFSILFFLSVLYNMYILIFTSLCDVMHNTSALIGDKWEQCYYCVGVLMQYA